jgi:hypothetical protein
MGAYVSKNFFWYAILIVDGDVDVIENESWFQSRSAPYDINMRVVQLKISTDTPTYKSFETPIKVG